MSRAWCGRTVLYSTRQAPPRLARPPDCRTAMWIEQFDLDGLMPAAAQRARRSREAEGSARPIRLSRSVAKPGA